MRKNQRFPGNRIVSGEQPVIGYFSNLFRGMEFPPSESRGLGCLPHEMVETQPLTRSFVFWVVLVGGSINHTHVRSMPKLAASTPTLLLRFVRYTEFASRGQNPVSDFAASARPA